MRSLVEEFGFIVIALVIASLMLSGLLAGIVMPELQMYVMNTIPNDTVNSNLEFSKNFNRINPVIISPESVTVNAGMIQIDFDDYISAGTIKAVNADGTDISSNIAIKAADDATAKIFDESNKVFGNSEVAEGVYKFIVSVVDYTDVKYYGKATEITFTISVINP